jgi:hypothetical protein
MRSAFIITLFLCCSALAGDDARPFLDDKLADWDGLMEYWSYKDGVLVGACPNGLKFNTFLCSKKIYRDFELKFEVRLKDGIGNSGIQIRSRLNEKNKDRFAVDGPQCDIGGDFWGSLYGENIGGMMKAADAALVKKILKPKDFNAYTIRCVGKRVTITLNGEVTVDGEFEKMNDEGIIAFQLHSGPPMEITFRNLEFTNLSK